MDTLVTQGQSTIGFRNVRHIGIRMHFAQVRLVSFRRSLDGIIARVPVRRADLVSISTPLAKRQYIGHSEI
jgi:hypothetical protein